MLNRPSHPKKKDVCVIVDVPNKIEIENEEPYSSASNLNLLTSLRTGKVYQWSKVDTGFQGINSLNIFKTYLDYDYYGQDEVEKNFDFCKEFCKRKDLTHENDRFFREVEELKIEYFPIPHQKDLYCSARLYKQFTSLVDEIRKTEPKLIIITGKWALFFLTGMVTYAQTAGNAKDRKPLGGLVKFRSSIMSLHECFGEFTHNPIVVPIYHPINAVGMPDKVPIMEIDIQKLAYRYGKIISHGTEIYRQPNKKYVTGKDKDNILSYLQNLEKELDKNEVLISVDIETMFGSIIDCIGVTNSINNGVCVAFATVDNPVLWSKEDELEIMVSLYKVLKHKNAKHLGQNYNYDAQFYYSHWLLNIHASDDTMVLHHILYNYLPKDLAFLASIYCEHYQYWKDDLTPSATNPEERWIYNIKDIQYTLEIFLHLKNILDHEDEKLRELYYFQQRRLSPALVSTMNRGVKVDVDEKEKLHSFFSSLMKDIEVKINTVLGFEFNQNSTPQKKHLFTDFFGMTLKKKRGGNETCDAAAMLSYIDEYPLYKPFLTLLLEYASLKVFVRNFLAMELDEDNRARTQYKIAGTATGRLSSSKNVRGKGGNFQNIPEKGKINLKYAVEVFEEEDEGLEFSDIITEGTIVLPNVKKMIIPDKGKELADFDLSGADIQIVAWDSECKWLMDYFANPRGNGKVYHYIASNFFQKEISDGEYKTYKAVFHGLNYLMGITKLATMARIPEYLASQLAEYYFHLNPEIKKWHERIEKDVKTKGYISNIFGRRAWFLNKNDVTLMNKAAAFIPQSSIADVINRATVDVYEKYRDKIDILMQVHDSLVLQYNLEDAIICREEIKKSMEVVVPYKNQLIIPSDYKVSSISYGDTKKIKPINRPVDQREFRIEEKNKLAEIL